MNTHHSEYILNIINKTNFINEWIKEKYKMKPIIIYGKLGTGKTSLANYILRDFTKININIESCKNIPSLKDHLDMSLYKKSITMMFHQENIYKCILFDDLDYIQQNDKSLFKSILQFSRTENKNHPIIYISNSIKHKNIHQIYKRCYPIHISFNDNQYIDITEKFFTNSKNYNIPDLIKKSNYNFNTIKINLDFHNNTNLIHSYDKNNDELEDFIKGLFTKNIQTIFQYSYSDSIIIGLNILENCIRWILNSTLDKYQKLHIINTIYRNNYLSDILLTKIHIHSDWQLTEYIIANTIVSPILLMRDKIKIDTINYNKYISKCIIYTYNRKLLVTHYLDHNILSFVYEAMNDYYHSSLENKQKKKEIIKSFIELYQIPIKVLDKFLKYYSDLKKTDIKLFY
tara:strand:+ start:169 stop:1371 length:1203 start_codon:yes stop_codon:yes gene_type:complete